MTNMTEMVLKGEPSSKIAKVPAPPARMTYVTSHYAGDMVAGKRDGHGTYVYDNKFFQYQGEWRDNKKHGMGVFSMSNGSQYEGEFRDGEMTGQGKRTWPDGSAYTGDFLEGEMHGSGVHLGVDGTSYDGQWCQSRRHGLGTLTQADGLCYDGEFKAHKFHGKGNLHLPNGDVIDGVFEDGGVSGHAQIKYADGNAFEGTFIKGCRQGRGRLTQANGGVTYDGEWKDDHPLEQPTKLIVEKVASQMANGLAGTQLQMIDGRFKVTYATTLQIKIVCGRVIIVTPTPLTPEEVAVKMEQLREAQAATGKKGKPAAKPGMTAVPSEEEEWIRQIEEEQQPRDEDVGTTCESGRTISMTMWKIGQDKDPKKGATTAAPRNEEGRELNPLLPATAESVPFPVQRPPSVASGLAEPSLADTKPQGGKKKSPADKRKSIKPGDAEEESEPVQESHDTITTSSVAVFPDVKLSKALADPGNYAFLFEDKTPFDSAGQEMPLLESNIAFFTLTS